METALAVIFGISTFFLLILWIKTHRSEKKKDKKAHLIWLCSMLYQWKKTPADEAIFGLMFRAAMLKSSCEESGFTSEEYQKGVVLLAVLDSNNSEDIVDNFKRYGASEEMIERILFHRNDEE